MKYPFMRELTGVPLVLPEARRRKTRSAFLATAGMLTGRHIEYLAEMEQRDAGIDLELYLHDPRANELVSVAGSADKSGIVEATISLMDTVNAPDPRALYTYVAEETVTRDQLLDFDAWLGVNALEAFADLKRRAAGEPPEPEPAVVVPALDALNCDTADLAEISGLRAYLDEKSAAGLYEPISLVRSIALRFRE